MGTKPSTIAYRNTLLNYLILHGVDNPIDEFAFGTNHNNKAIAKGHVAELRVKGMLPKYALTQKGAAYIQRSMSDENKINDGV